MRNIYPVKYYSAEGFVEHKLFETSEDTKSADVKVPPNCRMVEFDPNHLEQQ